ncbi:MAG: mechanosensitive ion channel family protein [Myxococcota bacterium]
MIWSLAATFAQLLTVFAGLLVLLFSLELGRRGLDLLPLRRQERELVDRGWPTLSLLVSAIFVAAAIYSLLADRTPTESIGILIGLVIAVGIGWSTIRDVVVGAVLRADRVCALGDVVRIGEGDFEIEGRIERLGYRSLVLVTSGGEEAVVPYSRIGRSSVVRRPTDDSPTPHVFQLVLGGRPIGAARDLIRRSALLSHWGSVVREPVVKLVDEDTVEVTAFVVDPDRGYDVEAEVRRSLARVDHAR